jgi:hypothetical protein
MEPLSVSALPQTWRAMGTQARWRVVVHVGAFTSVDMTLSPLTHRNPPGRALPRGGRLAGRATRDDNARGGPAQQRVRHGTTEGPDPVARRSGRAGSHLMASVGIRSTLRLPEPGAGTEAASGRVLPNSRHAHSSAATRPAPRSAARHDARGARRSAGRALRLGRPGKAHPRALLHQRPEPRIELEVSAQDAVGPRQGGRSLPFHVARRPPCEGRNCPAAGSRLKAQPSNRTVRSLPGWLLLQTRGRPCRTARWVIAGVETMHMIRKEQLSCPEGQAASAASQFRSPAFEQGAPTPRLR